MLQAYTAWKADSSLFFWIIAGVGAGLVNLIMSIAGLSLLTRLVTLGPPLVGVAIGNIVAPKAL